MTFEQASAIIGEQSRQMVKNMHKALGMMAYLNTPADNERREAAGMVLKNWPKHSALRQAARDAKYAYPKGMLMKRTVRELGSPDMLLVKDYRSTGKPARPPRRRRSQF